MIHIIINTDFVLENIYIISPLFPFIFHYLKFYFFDLFNVMWNISVYFILWCFGLYSIKIRVQKVYFIGRMRSSIYSFLFSTFLMWWWFVLLKRDKWRSKWVNSNYIWYGINSLRLKGLQVILNFIVYN